MSEFVINYFKVEFKKLNSFNLFYKTMYVRYLGICDKVCCIDTLFDRITFKYKQSPLNINMVI